jgi:hypothetical protein
VRYCSGLLILGLFVGCTNTDAPDMSNTDSTNNTTPHTVNKPVVNDDASVVNRSTDTSPNSDPSFNRGPDEATPPTNTGINERDQNQVAKTPVEQGNNKKDIDITAGIRQKIVNHEGMSINGRNVKIITDGGRVTLRGPVNSQEEKDLIAQFAKDVAGEANVENQLDLAPKTDEDLSPKTDENVAPKTDEDLAPKTDE